MPSQPANISVIKYIFFFLLLAFINIFSVLNRSKLINIFAFTGDIL